VPHAPATPADLLGATLRRDPAQPLLTYYDDGSGERTELSAATFANWVAKSANLLREELSVAAGDRVCLLLPAHWQTAAILLAVWSVGAVPVTVPAGAGLIAADEPRLAEAVQASATDVLGLSLRPMNAPLSDAPPGVVDYAAEVLGCADIFTADEPSGAVETQAAGSWAAEVGLTATDRVLVCGAVGVEDALDWFLAPLAGGSSVVLCHRAAETRLPDRAAAERVTATLGVTIAGIRRLDG